VGQLVQCSNADANYIKNNFIGSYLKGGSWSGTQALQNAGLSTRLKIPLTIGSDYLHGGPQIYFPHNIGIGASGNAPLAELAFRICAMSCKIGNNVDFAPTLDVARNDKYGRVYECFSENVDDTKIMARAAVRGLQGTDLSSDYTMIATAKHFAGAGGTQDGALHNPANTAAWAALCKIHLPQFHAAVDAGVASVMTAYNPYPTSATNSAQTPSTDHKSLITDTLKNGWGFDGFVISDWMMPIDAAVGGATNGPINSINAGLVVGMMPSSTDQFLSAIKGAAGTTIPLSRIEDAVKRHLRVKLRMGLFSNPNSKQELSSYLGAADSRKVARMCVRQSLVLLKNTGAVLPLKKTQKIHVVGTWADNIGSQCGGWSETGGDAWQGSMANAHAIAGATTLLQGLQAGISATGRVTYGATASGIPTDADVIVVAVGEVPYAEDAGYRADITLDAALQTLVQTCAASGKPVVTVLITGRPNALGTIPNNSAALVAAWLPGTEGGGIADVLFGDFNFTGKLRFTWPATSGQEPINTGAAGDAVGSGGTPLFAYGFGLTY
jgi:beta-glucosidase